jgi:hypothetical protein
MPAKPRPMTCQQCGQEFLTRDYWRQPPPKYCSRKCRDVAQTTRVTLECVQCLRQFERKAYMADWSRERGPFCGFDCYALWQAIHMRGEKNPNYRERGTVREAGQWMRNRILALTRDDYRCQDCGRQDKLHVHHVNPWQPEQEDPHVVDNLLTLCASCHRKRHPLRHGPDGNFLPNH